MEHDQIMKKAFETRPILKRIFDTNQHVSLLDYEQVCYDRAKKYTEEYSNAVRQKELLHSFHSLVSEILGVSVADSAVETLRTNTLVSTADHQGVLDSPFFLNSNLLRSWNQQKRGSTCLITLPCAGIPLDTGSFPRGLTIFDQSMIKKRILLKSLKEKHVPVYASSSFGSDIKQKIRSQLQTISLPTPSFPKILPVMEKIFSDPALFAIDGFDAQTTHITHHLWKALPGEKDTDLIYLSQEKLVVDLLTRFHIDTKTLIHDLLFDPQVTMLFQKYFNKIIGAFDLENNKGTFLFWGLEPDNRFGLSLVHNALVNTEKNFELTLTPRAVYQALLKKKIMPSMALIYIVISFYYGLVCGGGFSQVNYLTEMKDAWMKLLSDLHLEDEKKQILALPTDCYLGDYLVAHMPNDHSRYCHTLDYLALYDESTYKDVQMIAQKEMLGANIEKAIRLGFS